MPNIHFLPVNISSKEGPIVKVSIPFPVKLAEVNGTHYKSLTDFIPIDIFIREVGLAMRQVVS